MFESSAIANTCRGLGRFVVGGLLAAGTWSSASFAGVPECNNLRLTEVRHCEVRVEGECEVECEDFGVYEKACATQLQTVCSSSCTLRADPICTNDCTEACSQTCDRGENVICLHNCFGECTSGCDLECEGDVDPQRCRASCEANCDAECDAACEPLVDGDCYQHCVECCGGSCTAQANLSCQNVCQEQEFESCQYEMRGSCAAACDGEGALFCDGEFVLSGKQIHPCVEALLAQGLPKLSGWAEGGVTLGDDSIVTDVGAGLEGKAPKSGCNVVAPTSRLAWSLWAWPTVLALGIFALRRRS